MKTTVLFFNSEAEILEYGKKNNIEYIEHGVENAKEEWQEYYKPFAELDGCEVGFYDGTREVVECALLYHMARR